MKARNNQGKINMTTVLILVVLVILISGTSLGASLKINVEDWLKGGAGANTVPVDKKLKLALTDIYAGSALGSKTIYVYMGTTLKESLTTDSDGTKATAFTYLSGTEVSVKYVDSNTKQWFHFTVPEMNEKDAESATYNNIALEAFTVCTGTDALRVGATSLTDNSGTYNFTASGVTPQFTYDFFVTSDNTGFISSQDPIYSMTWQCVFYMKLSGTNYETVLIYDFDDTWTLGTTNWAGKVIPDDDITKYKVGNTYVHTGEMHTTFSLDGTGYTGNGTTLQVYLKIYSSINYHKTHGGNFGPDVVELAEHTITLEA